MHYAAILVGTCLLYILIGVELMPWIRKFQAYCKDMGETLDSFKHYSYPVPRKTFLDELWENRLFKK